MWFGYMPSCHWSSAPQNSDDDIWLFVQWGPLKPVNSAPQSLSILLLFNSTSERLAACWTGARHRDLNYSGGQAAQYLFFGNVGNQRAFWVGLNMNEHAQKSSIHDLLSFNANGYVYKCRKKNQHWTEDVHIFFCDANKKLLVLNDSNKKKSQYMYLEVFVIVCLCVSPEPATCPGCTRPLT